MTQALAKKPAVVRGFGAVKEEETAPGGLLGTSPSNIAKAFALIGGNDLGAMNDIAKAATVGGIAAVLEGNLPKELYLDLTQEAVALHTAGRLHAPQKPRTQIRFKPLSPKM